MADQPNFLVIMSDQHNPQALGQAGNAVTRTPHLNKLAERGAMFENAYCASPLCVRSRMSFMTAQHPKDIQTWTNQCFLSPGVPTFAHGLGAAGYEVTICGRMHFIGPDQRHAIFVFSFLRDARPIP